MHRRCVGGEGRKKRCIEMVWERKEGRRNTLNGCWGGGKERCIEWVLGGGKERCIEWVWEGKQGRGDALNGCGRGRKEGRKEGRRNTLNGCWGEGGGKEKYIEWVLGEGGRREEEMH